VEKAVSAGRAVVMALAGLALRTTATTGVGQLRRGAKMVMIDRPAEA